MNRQEALALVIAPMAPGYAREIVRATLKGWSSEDVDAWHRLKDNERKQAKRDALRDVRLAAPQQTGQVPVSLEREDRTSSGLSPCNKPDIAQPPEVPPVPPPNPASTPAFTPARPNVEQVVALMDANHGCRIPPENRREVAQAYLDTRARADPPWTLPATHDKPARSVGADWAADCRLFCRNWQEIVDRNQTREKARNATYQTNGNHSRKTSTPATNGEPLVPGGW